MDGTCNVVSRQSRTRGWISRKSSILFKTSWFKLVPRRRGGSTSSGRRSNGAGESFRWTVVRSKHLDLGILAEVWCLEVTRRCPSGTRPRPRAACVCCISGGESAAASISSTTRRRASARPSLSTPTSRETEVDQRQVNLTRFSLFFPEKRDFFLDGATFFDFAGPSTTTHVIPFLQPAHRPARRRHRNPIRRRRPEPIAQQTRPQRRARSTSSTDVAGRRAHRATRRPAKPARRIRRPNICQQS